MLIFIRRNYGNGKMKTRERWVDAIKGMAILCVVMGHTLDGVISRVLYVEANNVLTWIFDVIYAFHMPLFMTISGFLFYKAYFVDGEVIREKLNKQILNLVLLYFIYCLIYGLMKLPLSMFVKSDVGLKDILLIPICPLGPYWYLYAMIILYLIFGLDIVNKINQYVVLIVLFFVSIFSQFVSIGNLLGIQRIMFLAFFFYFGKILINFIEKKKYVVMGLFVGAIILFILFNQKCDTKIQYALLRSCIAFGLTTGICCIAFSLKSFLSKKIGAFLCYFGEHSLEIYVLHVFFVTGLNIIFDKLNILGIVGLLLTFILAVLMPIICAIILRKIKLYNFFFKPISCFIKKKG